MSKEYAIHPGWVTSNVDGDYHYVGAKELQRLYGVDPKHCILWDRDRPETFRGRRWEDYQHLFPSSQGIYRIL